MNACVTVLLAREGALWNGLFPEIQLTCALLLLIKQQQEEMIKQRQAGGDVLEVERDNPVVRF